MALNQALPSHSSGVVAVQPTSGKKPQRSLPRELTDLLKAADAVASKRMWSRFIAAHNRLLMAVAKSLGHGYDDAMDRYTYALDELKRDDFRRLRAYEAESAAKFEIWLVAVMRRLRRLPPQEIRPVLAQGRCVCFLIALATSVAVIRGAYPFSLINS